MINEEQFKALVAKNLANYRKINNLTQLDLAEQLSYSDKAISRWEKGEVIPDVLTLNKLCEIFNPEKPMKKVLFGGYDKEDVLKHIQTITELYQNQIFLNQKYYQSLD